MSRREIIDPNRDPIKQFEDLVAGFGTRDVGGLPLGNVLEHSLNRLSVCYEIIEAAKLAADYAQILPGHDGIPPNYQFLIVGDPPQDRQGTRPYPAAHLSPGRLQLRDPKSLQQPVNLYDTYGDDITRGFICSVFAKTELIHRLTNYADSICERKQTQDGMGNALVESCTLVARDRRAAPRQVLCDELIPKFKDVAGRQLAQMESTLTTKPPEVLEPSKLLDHQGQPYRSTERPTDTRIHSPSPEAWRANRQAVIQILATYAGTSNPKMGDVRKAEERFRALRANEERAALSRFRTR